jgi:cytochrome c
MKYYYLNKIAMAVLVALLLFFGTRTLIDIAYQEHPPEKPGYEVAGTEGDGHGKEAKPADEGAEFLIALNKADPAKGEQDVGLCKVCHSFDKDGPTMIGPGLYGVVGHKIAAHEGFNYTPALRKHEDQEWTFENLDKWLKNPQEFAPGTSMAFPGIPDTQKRANVVAYLNKNSDNPLPIPEAPAEEAASDEGAAEGADEAAAGKPEVLTLLATADAGRGEQGAALCKVCHTFDAGGATMVGPNLHNVVGADIAGHADFSYSEALKSKDGEWTYEQLDAWLANPQAFAPGTTMAFPGIPDAKKRADVIAFLRSMTENPPALPAAEEEATPAEEAVPAEEAAPAEEEAAPAEEEAAPAEEPAAEEPAAKEPAAEEPAAEDEAPLAAEPEEPSVTDEPAADEVMEEGREEIVVNPPTVSEDAPSEPSKGEGPSASQPQPVVPDEGAMAAEPEEPSVTDEPAADEVMEEGREEIIVNPPTVSEDAPSEPSKGEGPSASQPQPVVPDAMDAGSDSSDSMESSGDGGLSSQPQPVYPDGKPESL